MAVQVLITDRKHYTTWANDTDYLSNTSEFNTYLRGGVGNRQKVVYTVDVRWGDNITPNSGQTWVFDGDSSGGRISRSQGSWIEEGFSIGDTVTFLIQEDPPSTGSVSSSSGVTITNITDEYLFLDTLITANITATTIGGVEGINLQDGIEYSFGIIPNEDEPFFNSLLDNSNQTYYANGIGSSFVNMQPKTNAVKGWDSSRVGQTKVKRTTTTPQSVQEFVIEHEYIINPYNDSDLLDGNKSLKYVSQFSFRSSLAANINSAKTAIDSLQLGSVGYYDENYDGYNNDFTISNVVYTDTTTSNTQTSLNVKAKTNVTYNVNSASGLFATGLPVTVAHSYLPDFNTYNKSADSYTDTWVYEVGRNTIDAAANTNGIIKDLDIDLVSANQITVSYDLEFTTDNQSRLEEGYNYVLSCEVGSNLDGRDNVTLLVDENTYISENNITGLIVSNEFGFNAYDKFIAPKEDLFTTYKGWVADEVVSYHRFGVNRTSAKDAEILNGYFKVVAYNDVTGTYFELQNEQIDLSGQFTAPIGVIDNSAFTVQYIKDERTRGYNLPLGDEFNLLLFEAKDNDATYQYYEYRVGFKMNWQDWIALPGADAVFIDTTKDFNGLNNNASNYNLSNDYSIRVLWQFEMQGLDSDGNTGTTTYNFYSSAFDVYDFGQQDDDPTTWTTELFTFDEDGNNLNGKVSTDQKTLVRTVFTPTAPYVIDSNIPWWAEYRIAEQNQTGFNNDVITTTKNYSQNNRLIPKDGESYVTLDIDNNTIITECLVDNTKLISGRDYKIDSYLRNANDPPATIRWRFNTEVDVDSTTFDPLLTVINGELPTWTFVDESQIVTQSSLSVSGRTQVTNGALNGVCQEVLVTFSTNDATNVTGITLNTDDICEHLDLTLFTNIGSINVSNNHIDSIEFPTTTNEISNLSVAYNNLDIIDLSPLSNLGTISSSLQTDIDISNNPSTSVINPNSDNKIGRYFCNDMPNLQTLDVSGLNFNKSFGSQLHIDRNNSLTDIVFPSGSGNMTLLHIRSNPSLVTLDLRNLVDTLHFVIDISGNTSLVDVFFPIITREVRTLRAYSCPSLSNNTLDISNLQAFGSSIQGSGGLYANDSNLTDFVYYSNSLWVQRIEFQNNNFTSLDFSNMTGLYGTLYAYNNNNLHTVTFDSNSNEFSNIRLNNCNISTINFTAIGNFSTNSLIIHLDGNNLSQSSVDSIFSHLNSKLTTGTGQIYLDGTNSLGNSNAAPTNGASNADVLSLISKGYTVKHN